MIHESFMNLKNRNQRARELKAQGYHVRRYSFRNQLLHPMYIKDFPRELTSAEKGFGNTIYKTYFKSIYCLEAVKEEQ